MTSTRKPATKTAAQTTSKAATKATTKTTAKAGVKAAPKAPKKANASTTRRAATSGRPAVKKAAVKPVATKGTTVSTVSASAPIEVTPAQSEVGTSRVSRENSMQARIVAMLAVPEGASLNSIMSATGWQAHTVRGFISGTARKKLGLTIQSARVDGQRLYRVAA